MIRGDGYSWMRWKPYSVVLGSYARNHLTYFHLKWDVRCDKNISQWKRGEPSLQKTWQALLRWRTNPWRAGGLRPALDPTVFGSDYFLTLGCGVCVKPWPQWLTLAPGFWCFDPISSCGIPIDTELVTPPFWFRQMENCKSKVARTRIWTGDHWYSSMNSSYSFEKTVFNYIFYIDYININILK